MLAGFRADLIQAHDKKQTSHIFPIQPYRTAAYIISPLSPRTPKVNDINVLLGLIEIPPDGIVPAPLVLRVDHAGPAAAFAAAGDAGDAARGAAVVGEDPLLGGAALIRVPPVGLAQQALEDVLGQVVGVCVGEKRVSVKGFYSEMFVLWKLYG